MQQCTLPRATVGRVRTVVLVAALIALFLAGTPTFAAPTTAAQAKLAVQHWLAGESKSFGDFAGHTIASVTPETASGQTDYFAVQLNPAGFVLVSADDEIEPILCFAPGGTFSPAAGDPLGDVVRVDAARRLSALVPGSQSAGLAQQKWNALLTFQPRAGDTGITGVTDLRVAPFVQSLWNQTTDIYNNACYNYYTPPYAAGNPNNFYSGCVATAIAQLMRFYEWPTTGVGTGSYTITVSGSLESASLRGGDGAGGPYNWANMPLIPDAQQSTTAQYEEVGDICYDAGVASSMDYTSSESAASMQTATNALTSVFAYSNAIHNYNYSVGLTGSQIDQMVNSNLDCGLPVTIAMYDAGFSSGHCVLADGYGYNSGTLYHHINLGWGGYEDAWYNLAAPDISTDDFTIISDVIYNVYTAGSGECLSGRVVNTSGTALSGAFVSITGGGITRSATTNAYGVYGFSKLPSNATYTVSCLNTSMSEGVGQSSSGINGNVWGANLTVTPGPPTPTGLVATPESGSISLSWTASTGATSYNVYRGTAVGGESPTAYATGITATTYVDSGLTSGTYYYYRVAALNATGVSVASTEAGTTPIAPVPAAPTGINPVPGSGQVRLTWTGSTGATSYNLYRATVSGAEGTTPIGVSKGTNYLDSGLTNGYRYYYVLTAVNAMGTSAPSVEVSASLSAPIPTAPTGLTATGGNAQVALSWTASSGQTSYNIYRGTAGGGESATTVGTATGTSTTYLDSGLTNGVKYYYTVAAMNAGGTSAPSNEASATTAGPSGTNLTHILWSNPNGSLALWNYNPATGAYTQNIYGPFAGWTPKSIADGPDGLTRVLWTCTTGAVSVWIVNGATGTYTQNAFGPYAGWTALGLSVSSSNVTHIAWVSAGGAATVWNYTGSTTFTQSGYGPYGGWTLTSIADGPDSLMRAVWVSSGGVASIWSMNNTTGAISQNNFGPFTGWTATDVSVGFDNTTHVLWTNGAGSASLWNYNTTTGATTPRLYGPFTGWTPASVADAPDGTRLLWDGPTGAATIWDVNNTTGTFTQNMFGPFTGWTATAVTAYP